MSTNLHFRHEVPENADLAIGNLQQPGDNINLNFTGEYIVPDGGNVPLEFGVEPIITIPTVEVTIEGALQLTALFNVGLANDTTITGTLPTPTGSINMEYNNSSFRGFTTSTKFPYQKAIESERLIVLPWSKPEARSHSKNIPWTDAEKLEVTKTTKWQKGIPLEDRKQLVWEDTKKLSTSRKSGWQKATRFNHHSTDMVWDSANKYSMAYNMPWIVPTPTPKTVKLPWQVGKFTTYKRVMPWQLPEFVTYALPELPWEYGVCAGQGEHPAPPEPPEPPEPPFVGDTDLDFVCPMEARPRVYKRNLLAFGDTPCMGLTLPPPIYVTMADATLIRTSDSLDVPILNMSVGTNFGSWTWTFNGILSTEQALGLVKPNGSGLVELKATINGYEWLVYVESWQRDWVFNRKSWRVSGRAVSAELADPNALPASRHETTLKSAAQSATDELLNTGWTLDWDTTDWLVDAGLFNYTDKTPIEAIKILAESIGARVQTAPGITKTIKVTPRYKISPWDWAAATPDIAFDYSRIRAMGVNYKPVAKFDAVYVSGQDAGIACNVTRQGTGGLNPAPMVINPLVTQAAMATERGRQVLAAGGTWEIYTMQLPLSVDVPLMVPGSLVEITHELETWIAHCTDVQVAIDRTMPVKITQSVKLERYYG